MTIEIRLVVGGDRGWIREMLVAQWGATIVVTRGRVHDGDRLPGLVALCGGARAGLLTFDHRGDELEIVTLNAQPPGQGIGTALVTAVRALAAAFSCRRLWLVTTNDNESAIEFYRRRGFSIAAVHRGAVTAARRLKPQIPLTGVGGVTITDEVELQLALPVAPDAQDKDTVRR